MVIACHPLGLQPTHFEMEGKLMNFALNIIAVPESHTGFVLAGTFQSMLSPMCQPCYPTHSQSCFITIHLFDLQQCCRDYKQIVSSRESQDFKDDSDTGGECGSDNDDNKSSVDDDVNELEALSEEEQYELLADVSIIKETIQKVILQLLFSMHN